MPYIDHPFQDPLITLTWRLREWFAAPRAQTLLAQMGITPPAVGFTGWKQREQQLNQGPGQANRVLIIPGSYPDGANQGRLIAPLRRKGLLHRVNATWERVFTLSTWAVDTSDTHNEEKQIQAVSSLMNTCHAALREVLHGDFPGTGDVFRDPKVSANMGFGDELLCQLTFNCEMRGMPVNLSGTPVTVDLDKET